MRDQVHVSNYGLETSPGRPARVGFHVFLFLFFLGQHQFFIIIIINRFYIALFSALEQTHCARM